MRAAVDTLNQTALGKRLDRAPHGFLGHVQDLRQLGTATRAAKTAQSLDEFGLAAREIC